MNCWKFQHDFIICFTDLTEDLAQHEPPVLSFELRHTVEEITAECENIYWLEQRLADWAVRIKSFTNELESFNLTQYFHFISDTDDFIVRDKEIRRQIVAGETFMIRKTGEIVHDLREAQQILFDYPCYEVHKVVETERHPEYDAFDDAFNKSEMANNRCLITTVSAPVAEAAEAPLQDVTETAAAILDGQNAAARAIQDCQIIARAVPGGSEVVTPLNILGVETDSYVEVEEPIAKRLKT